MGEQRIQFNVAGHVAVDQKPHIPDKERGVLSDAGWIRPRQMHEYILRSSTANPAAVGTRSSA